MIRRQALVLVEVALSIPRITHSMPQLCARIWHIDPHKLPLRPRQAIAQCPDMRACGARRLMLMEHDRDNVVYFNEHYCATNCVGKNTQGLEIVARIRSLSPAPTGAQ